MKALIFRESNGKFQPSTFLYITIYESVESVCVNDESESGSNINLLELSRIKEGPGEEAQGKERSSSSQG